MNPRNRDALSPGLAAHVDAFDAEPPPHMADTAQQRLLARLGRARRPQPARARWFALASAAALALVVLALPLSMDQGRAFAAVQAQLRNFHTLSMHVEQRMGGELIEQSNTVVDARGVLRTDVGMQLSIIVDPVRGRLLTLDHDARQAMLMPMPTGPAAPETGLGWLAKVRDFKGRAEPLARTRVIDGHVARGWAIDTGGDRIVLWAGVDGRPLAMEAGGAGGLEIRYRFDIDAPIAPGYLSSDVPPGYTLETDTAEGLHPHAR